MKVELLLLQAIPEPFRCVFLSESSSSGEFVRRYQYTIHLPSHWRTTNKFDPRFVAGSDGFTKLV